MSGVAIYRERMALPADASFEATLEDSSRADAPARVIWRSRLDPAGQPPFRFSISYEPAGLEAKNNYGIRARVTRAGQLLFTTDRHYALPAAGQELELMLVRVQQQQQGTATVSTATLENTYWKLARLGTTPSRSVQRSASRTSCCIHKTGVSPDTADATAHRKTVRK